LSFDLFVLQALQREDSYEETIRDLTARLKDVSFQRFYQKHKKCAWKLNLLVKYYVIIYFIFIVKFSVISW